MRGEGTITSAAALRRLLALEEQRPQVRPHPRPLELVRGGRVRVAQPVELRQGRNELDLRLSEPAAAMREVVHISRERLHEPVHLVDELRDEGESDRDDRKRNDEVRDAEKRSRDVAEHMHSTWGGCVTDLRDLSRPLRRKSHYPTVVALQNSLQKLITMTEETGELIDYLERQLNFGLTREELQSGKPIIGIAQTGSDLSPCNRHHLVLAERTREGDLDREERYDEAIKYARRALETANTDLTVPANATAQQIESAKRVLLSMAHSAIGMVDLNRKNDGAAVQEFQQSIALSTPGQVEPLTYLRLALAQDHLKQYADALVSANKAVESSPANSPVAMLAKQEVDRLSKLQGSEAPNPSPAPPQQGNSSPK